MSMTEFQSVFQPLWAAETRATEWLWPWTVAAPANPAPVALLTGEGGGSAVLTKTPTPGGSWVRAQPEGVVMHLGPADAASIKGRDVLMGLWLTPATHDPADVAGLMASGEPDACGLLIVADWATQPHAGTA